jgi:hypothetical protein
MKAEVIPNSVMKSNISRANGPGRRGLETKLVFVADLGRLKTYRLEDSPEFSRPRLTLIEDRETEVTHHVSEDVTDQLGRHAKVPTVAGARSDAEEHNLKLERDRRAAKIIGRRIGELIDREQVETCYFSADSRINEMVLQHVEPARRNKIQKNIPANFSKVDPDKLIQRFCQSRT